VNFRWAESGMARLETVLGLSQWGAPVPQVLLTNLWVADIPCGTIFLRAPASLRQVLSFFLLHPRRQPRPNRRVRIYAILHGMPHWIALDIGGTTLRAACYSPDNLTPAHLRKIPAQPAGPDTLPNIIELVRSVWPAGQTIAGIGVAAPGPVDPYAGVVLIAPSLPGWENLPLRQILSEALGTPVYVGNDANVAALGEWVYGAGQGHQDLIYLTISTGIGGGIIANGQLLLGANGLAGELGHVTVLPDGPLCSCGRRGHLEALASGPSIARWVEEQLQQGTSSGLPRAAHLSARQIALAAQAGDSLAGAAFERAGAFLGEALAIFINIFNPSAVILGGGVALSGELLFAPIRKILKRQVYSHHFLDKLKLTSAALGDEAGLLGALALAQGLAEKSP
jgi:glucokinase